MAQNPYLTTIAQCKFGSVFVVHKTTLVMCACFTPARKLNLSLRSEAPRPFIPSLGTTVEHHSHVFPPLVQQLNTTIVLMPPVWVRGPPPEGSKE